jgi:hypothetical protein
MASVGMAIALAKFIESDTQIGKILVISTSVLMLLLGFAALVYAYFRNKTIMNRLQENKFPADYIGPTLIVIAGGIICILSLIIVVIA